MRSEKLDRRVKYTKMVLKKSLVELMGKYQISKISIKMLCESADINRSTFYAHYRDQFDLLKQLEQEVIAELKKHITKDAFSKKTPETVQSLNQILDYIAKNADIFRILLGENGSSSFHNEIMTLAQEKTISDIMSNPEIDERTSEYLRCFAVTGVLSIVQKWLQDGMIESTQTMSELSSKLLYNGLSEFEAGHII